MYLFHCRRYGVDEPSRSIDAPRPQQAAEIFVKKYLFKDENFDWPKNDGDTLDIEVRCTSKFNHAVVRVRARTAWMFLAAEMKEFPDDQRD